MRKYLIVYLFYFTYEINSNHDECSVYFLSARLNINLNMKQCDKVRESKLNVQLCTKSLLSTCDYDSRRVELETTYH